MTGINRVIIYRFVSWYTLVVKTCKGCQQILPATSDHFYRHAGRKDGLTDRCKSCEKARVAAYEKANKDKANERKRRWAEDNNDKTKAARAKYAQANPDKVAASRRAYSSSERNRQRMARYREENREAVRDYYRRYYAANTKRIREQQERYNRAHPEQAKSRKARRRARERQAEGRHTASDIRAIYERQDGLCFYCSVPLNEIYHLDHRIPLSRGGDNSALNLVCTCSRCNLSKGGKTEAEFLAFLDS
jgi:5-methylcytosine-specific restriction endonuclease McrA